ncbi:hypothetical protein [Flavobacterium sp.]
MGIIYAIGIIVCIVACWLWCKFVMILFGKIYRIINRKKIQEQNNPYIQAQKLKMANDKNYEDYLEWMNKHSYGVPFQKIMTREEFEAENKISSLIS